MTTGRRHRQAGVTLIELSAVVLILGLVLAAATAGFMATTKNSAVVENRVENLGHGQILMRNLSKDLRTATPVVGKIDKVRYPAFTIATPWRVQFYAYLDTTGSDPKLVEIAIDSSDPKDSKIVEKIWEPLPGTVPPTNLPQYAVTPTARRLVGGYITNTATSGVPMFRYFSNSDVATPLGVGTSPLGGADRTLVYAVGISLRVRKPSTATTKGTTLENRVRLPNAIYTPPS